MTTVTHNQIEISPPDLDLATTDISMTPPVTSADHPSISQAKTNVIEPDQPQSPDTTQKSCRKSRAEWINARNPFRSPQARWFRAIEIITNEKRFSPRYDEPQLKPVLKYCRQYGKAHTDHQRAAVMRRYPALHRAHHLYESGGPIVWEIKARLIAGESFKAVAEKTGEQVEVIVNFESVFFHVANSLGATDWLIVQVIRVRDWTDRKPTIAQVWMYSSMCFGPFVVDILVDDFHGRRTPNVSDPKRLVYIAQLLSRGLCAPISDVAYTRELLAVLPKDRETDFYRRVLNVFECGTKRQNAANTAGKTSYNKENTHVNVNKHHRSTTPRNDNPAQSN